MQGPWRSREHWGAFHGPEVGGGPMAMLGKEVAGTRTADTQEIKSIERDVQTSTRTR